MTEAPHESSPQRGDITGLRALAVLAVILFHFSEDPLLPGGFLGVDVFFVISGYVISLSLFSYPQSNFGRFLLDFYRRRVKRLIPALAFVVLVSGFGIALFDPEPITALKTGMAALFGLSNMFLLAESQNYFAAEALYNVFTHTWSLGVEEQFYFIFPALFWLTVHRGAHRSRHFFAMMLALSSASFAGYVLARLNPSAAFFLMPLRFWELGIGTLVCLANREGVLAKNRIPVAWVGMVGLLAAFALPESRWLYSTPLAVVATALLIWKAEVHSLIYRVFASRPAVWIGLVSYSLYLWHWPVLVLSRWTIGITWLTAPFQLAAMFGLASLSFYLIEDPLRRRAWSITYMGTIAKGLTASFAVAIVLIGIAKPLKGKLFLGETKHAKEGTHSAFLASKPALAEVSKATRMACDMTPNQLSGADYRPAPDLDDAFFARCLEPKGAGKIILVGDSFASGITQHMALIADDLGMRFGVVYGYGCPYPLLLRDIASHQQATCLGFDETMLRDRVLAALKPGDILVVRLYLSKQQYLAYPLGGLPPVTAYDKALADLSGAVEQRGAGMLLIGSNPTLNTRNLMSLAPQWFNRGTSTESINCRANSQSVFDLALDEHLKASFSKMPARMFLSVYPHFSVRGGAFQIRQGDAIYFSDRQHLTPRALDLIAADVKQSLQAIRQTLAKAPR